MWKRSPREIVSEELGTLRYADGLWHATPQGISVPLVLRSGRGRPDAGMLAVAVSLVANLPQLEERARRYVEELSPEPSSIGMLDALTVSRPSMSWVRAELAPRDRAAADAIVSGEPVATLQFEIIGERDVLDVTFVGGVPVDAEVH